MLTKTDTSSNCTSDVIRCKRGQQTKSDTRREKKTQRQHEFEMRWVNLDGILFKRFYWHESALLMMLYSVFYVFYVFTFYFQSCSFSIGPGCCMYMYGEYECVTNRVWHLHRRAKRCRYTDENGKIYDGYLLCSFFLHFSLFLSFQKDRLEASMCMCVFYLIILCALARTNDTFQP